MPEFKPKPRDGSQPKKKAAPSPHKKKRGFKKGRKGRPPGTHVVGTDSSSEQDAAPAGMLEGERVQVSSSSSSEMELDNSKRKDPATAETPAEAPPGSQSASSSGRAEVLHRSSVSRFPFAQHSERLGEPDRRQYEAELRDSSEKIRQNTEELKELQKTKEEMSERIGKLEEQLTKEKQALSKKRHSAVLSSRTRLQPLLQEAQDQRQTLCRRPVSLD